MVISEFFKIRDDGVKLYKTYSDKNFKILQVETGIIYDEAIDIGNNNYTYEETDIPIVEENIEETTEGLD